MTDSKKKIVGQALLQVNQIMKPLELYGMQDYVEIAKGMIKELLEQVVDRAQGDDVPIMIDPRRIKW